MFSGRCQCSFPQALLTTYMVFIIVLFLIAVLVVKLTMAGAVWNLDFRCLGDQTWPLELKWVFSGSARLELTQEREIERFAFLQ